MCCDVNALILIQPPALDGGVDRYELRDVDDGEPDMDFPALPPDQPLTKFKFEQLALVEKSMYRDCLCCQT